MEDVIKKLKDLLSVIESLENQYTTNGLLNNDPTIPKFLYRGMSSNSYKLLPSVLRRIERETDDARTVEDYKYLSYGNYAESLILKEFIKEAAAVKNIPNDKLFYWAELAQHFGAPTRYLDWSSNPFVALYFACESESKQDAVVWVLHYYNYYRYVKEKDANCYAYYQNDTEYKKNNTVEQMIEQLLQGESDNEIVPQFPLVYLPRYIDSRMSAQSSWFMAWGTNDMPLEEMVDKKQYMHKQKAKKTLKVVGVDESEQFLYKVCVKPENKRSILRELDRVGINRKTLFPGMDGIGEYIRHRFDFDFQEMISRFFS